MFGCLFQMRYLNNFSNSLILLEISFMLTFLMAYLAFLYFVNIDLVLISRAVTNHFPDPSIFTFYSEDVVSILSRLSNFSDNFKISYIFSYVFKVTRSSLSLISLCFLKLHLPQFLMFTETNKSWIMHVWWNIFSSIWIELDTVMFKLIYM